jgi:Vanadium chloroperoxidase N-terminal domain
MDAILYWNEVALDAVAQDFTPKTTPKPEQGGPTKTSRALAIVHLGMYDAYNGIANQYQPYLNNLPCPITGASAEAAIAQAAFQTLSQLYPSQYKIFLQKYQDFFAVNLGNEQAIFNGKTYGEQIATAILKNRQDDNSKDTSTSKIRQRANIVPTH